MSHVSCSICSTQFEPHFRYQQELIREGMNGEQRAARYAFFCSQRCLEASHHQRESGLVECAACTKRFEVTLALQIVFTGGKRHYACDADCRKRLLRAAHSIRLGELSHPEHTSQAQAEAEASLISAISNNIQQLDKKSPVSSKASVLPSPAREASRSQTEPSSGGARVLAVFNHKGGTAKTTTAVSLSAGLALRGQRVLLLDTDSQGNVGTSLHLKFERSLYHVIVMGLDYCQAVINARPGLDVLPANETLAAAELYLSGRKNRDRLLRQRLDRARAVYDYIVVDCSPSLSLLNQNALVMCDYVLCPVACDYLSLVGVRQVLRTIRHVNQFLGHPVELWGVLPTLYDARARVCHEAYDTLKDHFGARCLAPVRHAAKVKEAPSQGKTVFEYAPGSSAMADYMAVVEKLININGSHSELKAGGVA